MRVTAKVTCREGVITNRSPRLKIYGDDELSNRWNNFKYMRYAAAEERKNEQINQCYKQMAINEKGIEQTKAQLRNMRFSFWEELIGTPATRKADQLRKTIEMYYSANEKMKYKIKQIKKESSLDIRYYEVENFLRKEGFVLISQVTSDGQVVEIWEKTI